MKKNAESKAEKIIKLLEMKFCSTIVKRLICVILLAFEIEKVTISEKLKLSMKSVKKCTLPISNFFNYVRKMNIRKHGK